MKRVYTARGTAEAHLIRAFLESAGIAAIVRGETLSTVFGGVPIDGDSLPSVWVTDAATYDRAIELIEETSRRRVQDDAERDGQAPPDWVCAACGETVPSQSDRCWNCGAYRDQGG